MAREIQKCKVVKVSAESTGEWPDVAKVNEVHAPSETEPGWPTPEQVDAYIDRLEYELSVGCDDERELPDHVHVGEGTTKVRPNAFSLFWGFVSAAVGCFWWLAKIISKALN